MAAKKTSLPDLLGLAIGSETLNNSLRYMDQIIAVVSGKDISEEQFTGATGKIKSDAAKQVGYRQQSEIYFCF